MKRAIIWSLVGLNTLIGVIQFIAALRGSSERSAEILINVVVIVVFSILGALIIVRTDGNRIGWLLLLLGFVLADPFRLYLILYLPSLQPEFSMLYPIPQPEFSFAGIFAAWAEGWFFFVILYTVFLILLHFPTGYPPSPRWNIVTRISLFTFAQFVLVYTFQPRFGDQGIRIASPIARLPVAAEDTLSGLVFGLGMIFLAISSLLSIFVRYRQAKPRVRAQIRWLLYAGVVAFFAIWYRLLTYEPNVNDWTDYLLTVALLILAAAVAIAVLRYRLYDIDLIIRRTVQYALLTGILALVFLGVVIVLQGLFQGLTGNADSPLVTVISTLLIAALFNPLRIRTQDWIDHRFYRAKYDAEKALADFARTARDEVDMARLSDQLVGLVAETMKPTKVRLLLTKTRREEGL